MMEKEIACNVMVYLPVDGDVSEADAEGLVMDKLDETGLEYNIFETEVRDV